MRSSYPKDLTGCKFTKLTVIRLADDNESEARIRSTPAQKWLCKCDCGNMKVVARANLISGCTKSCGCLQHRKGADIVQTQIQNTIPDAVQMDPITHGALRRIWNGMRNRCYSNSYKDRENYMDRGITIFPEWRDSFNAFARWALNNGFQQGLSIDRINPNGNYAPHNCRFITMDEQQRNKQNSIKLTIDPAKYNEYVNRSIRSLAKEFGVSESTIRSRQKRGWSPEEAIGGTTTRQFYYGGRTMAELAEICGIAPGSLRAYMSRHGTTVRDALLYYAKRDRRQDLVDWIMKNVPDTRDAGYRYPERATIQTNLSREREIEKLITEDLAQADAELLEQLHDLNQQLLNEDDNQQ